MEALNEKRDRLRDELQDAYEAWMAVSTRQADAEPGIDTSIDTSGSSEGTKVQWRDYLAAKDRLVRAYAEHPPAG
jgi:hypothetical protein